MESGSDLPSPSADTKGQRAHPFTHRDAFSAHHCTGHLLSAAGARAGVSALGVSYNSTVTLAVTASTAEEMPMPCVAACFLNQS